MSEDIGDTLRAMLRAKLRSDAAYKAADTRARRRYEATEAGLVRKRKARERAKAKREAGYASGLVPRPTKVKAAGLVARPASQAGIIRKDGEGNRYTLDRYGRDWSVEPVTRTGKVVGWRAKAKAVTLPSGAIVVPTILRGDAAALRSAIKRVGRDLHPYCH